MLGKTQRALRQKLGVVTQEAFLFEDTIEANIRYGSPNATRAEVVAAAEAAQCAHVIERLPRGYDTRVGAGGVQLAIGERQRIAIARAILADPRVLILDDATSSVDPTKEHEIRDALNEVMLGRTTIVIAHRPATIALASAVVGGGLSTVLISVVTGQPIG